MQTIPFSPQEVMGDAYSEFAEQQALYDVCHSWYSGEALDATRRVNGKDYPVYPLHLNPIANACHKHAQALLGAFDDSADIVITPKVVRRHKENDLSANQLEDALALILSENKASSLFFENALISQVHGGSILRANWLDDDNRISIEKVAPSEFWCIPYFNNPWRLRKAWVVRPISQSDAIALGANAGQPTYWYIEVWTEKEYTIQINANPLIQYDSQLNSIKQFSGPNTWGVVPFVYIPHIRSTRFWGDSLITTSLQQLTKELNARLVDIGDAVSEDAHSTLAMRNTKNTPEFISVAKGVKVLDLGNSNSISGSENEPDLFAVSRDSLNSGMLELVKNLHGEFMRESSVPAVAYGEDEGSQRSSATLAARMYPLVSHTKCERLFWNSGLLSLYKIIIIIAIDKGLYGLTKEHLQLTLKNNWPTILPRDRKELTDELTARMGAKLGSIEQLLGQFGDVEDVDTVVQQIKAFLEFEADLKARDKSSDAPMLDSNIPEDDRPPKGVSN